MGVMAIGSIRASSLVEKTANWVVLKLAIGRCPKTLAFKMESADILGAGILSVRRLRLRTWCLALAFGLVFA